MLLCKITLQDKAEPTHTRSLTVETAQAQLSKTGGTPHRVTEALAETEDEISVPISEISELRRAVLEELEEVMIGHIDSGNSRIQSFHHASSL